MNNRRLRRILIATALLVILAACGRPDSPSGQTGSAAPPAQPTAHPAATDELGGTKWLLASINTPDSQTPIPPAAGITAEFKNGELGGSAGCNSYSARFTRNGQAFAVSEIVQTEMACLDADAMAREQAFLGALQSARSIVLSGDALTIGYDGGELRFTRRQPTPDRPLEGTAWQLTTFVSGEIASSLLSGTRINAEFTEGKLSGTAGCNEYFGSYTLSESAISVGELGSTKKACPDDIMRQEQAFLQALRGATAFSIAGDQLTIEHAGGKLVFAASTALP